MSALLGRIPSAVGYQPTLATEMGALQERITSTKSGFHHLRAPIELPGELQRSLLELMSRLSLTYGAIDLVLTPDGRYVFLEINPNGQWLWIDEMLSLGISHSIAEWLSEGTK